MDTGDRDYYCGKFECIDVIESVVADLQGNEAFLTAQCLKYLWRWKRKDAAKSLEDLIKCRWYLNRLISHLEATDDSCAEQDDVPQVQPREGA